jgi:cytochrome b561
MAQRSIGLATARELTYDGVTIAFHWVIAFLVLFQFMLALWPGLLKGSVVLHRNVGLLILFLVVLRIVWRLTFGRGSIAGAGEPLLLRLAAKGAHLALYALLIVTPLLGWLYSDAKAYIVEDFGLELPMLVYYDRALALQIYFWKQVAAYLLLALIFAHAVAALGYHALIRKDAVLNSMLPERFRRSPSI